jgi:hypothetical protein
MYQKSSYGRTHWGISLILEWQESERPKWQCARYPDEKSCVCNKTLQLKCDFRDFNKKYSKSYIKIWCPFFSRKYTNVALLKWQKLCRQIETICVESKAQRLAIRNFSIMFHDIMEYYGYYATPNPHHHVHKHFVVHRKQFSYTHFSAVIREMLWVESLCKESKIYIRFKICMRLQCMFQMYAIRLQFSLLYSGGFSGFHSCPYSSDCRWRDST